MNKIFWVIKDKNTNDFIIESNGDFEVTESITNATAYDNKDNADTALEELYDSDIYSDWCSDDCEGDWEVVEVEATYKLK